MFGISCMPLGLARMGVQGGLVMNEHVKLRSIAVPLLALGLSAGCTDEVLATSAQQLLTPRAEPALAQQLVADSQYMTSVFGIDNSGPRRPSRINLADPAQY